MPIYPRGKSWMVSVGSKADRFRQTYATREEAELAEAQAIVRLRASGSPLEAPTTVQPLPFLGHTLKDAHDLTWRLYWKTDKGHGCHKATINSVFRTIPSQVLLTDITPAMILEAIEEWEDEGNSGSTVNRKVSHISKMLTTAAEQGWISSVPKLPRRKPGKHRIRWMSEAEELKVLNACTQLGLDDLRDYIVVAVDTGFRRSELLGLVANDFVNGMVQLHAGSTKSDKARAVPATTRVAEVLTRRSSNRKLFDIPFHILRARWLVLKSHLGMDDDPQFVVHMLRHTCASRLVQRGVNLAVVQQWMGHSNIATTLRYAHLAPDSLAIGREALEQVSTKPLLKVVNG
jgi:integrase